MKINTNRNIFYDLAILSESGIAIVDGARRVASSHADLKNWPLVIKKLSSGQSLAVSLAKSGLASPYEQEIISVAEDAGRTAEGLRWIAKAYDKRMRRVNRLKSKLLLPISILMIGIIVSSILTISKNPSASMVSVLIQAAIYFLLAIFLTKLIFKFLRKDSSGFLGYISVLQQTIFYKELFEQVVFGALLWNLKSGIDLRAAFIRVSKLLPSKHLKNNLLKVSRLCQKGLTMTESIKKTNLPITKNLIQIMEVGELSGRLESSIEGYLEQQIIMLDLKIESAFEWAPRFYYILTAIFAISVII